jgi:hypothetical protein
MKFSYLFFLLSEPGATDPHLSSTKPTCRLASMRCDRRGYAIPGLDSTLSFPFFLHFVILSRNYLGRNHTHQATEYLTTRTWTGPVFPFYHISFFFPTKRLGLNHSQANPTTHFPTLPATTTGPGTSLSLFISLPVHSLSVHFLTCPFPFCPFLPSNIHLFFLSTLDAIERSHFTPRPEPEIPHGRPERDPSTQPLYSVSVPRLTPYQIISHLATPNV